MSSGSIRIIQLPEKSSVNTDDYMAVDSSANGTKKVKFTDLLDNNLSAQNKAADAQATGEAINDISARVNNMINTQTNASVTTLWTGSIDKKNQTATLSESIANFDFVDIYVSDVDTVFARKPVSSSVHFEIQTQNMSDDASVQFLRWYETGLTISGTTATINKAIRCYWDDFSQHPVVAQAGSDGGANIIRIDGVKIGHVENDEIVDARVGVDGTSYPNLGDSIRGQITNVKNDVSETERKLENDISEKEKIYLGTLTMDYWKQSNLNEYASTYGRFITADVLGGETYYISGTCVNSAFPLAIMVDASNTVLSTIYTSDGDAVNDYELKVPATCTKVYVNGRRWNGGAGFNYPSIYKYSYGENAVDANSESISKKQSKVNRWIKSPVVSEYVDRYMYIQSGVLYESSDASAGGYNYKKIAYNKNETYRFYGLCKTNVIPIVICCDEYDNIIKLYGYTAGDAFKGEVITDIPQTTKYIYVNGLAYLESSAEIARERSVVSLTTNKVGVCLGDSITQGANVYVDANTTPYKDYPSIISNLLDCTIYNGGLGGATYASGRTIDFVNVVNCIVSGDYSSVISGIDQYGLNQSAKVQYASIAELDFNDVDFITLAYGTNDWNFGTSASTITTAMQSGISALLTAYPHLKIYIFTPIYRFNIQGSGEDSDTFVNPTSGLKLHDVCEAIMDCAKIFNVPCKDMYYECNINQYNKALYMGDDTHPNANGYALMGDKFGKYINSN